MYIENYLYNPISSLLEPYDLMTFNGINVLAPRNNIMNGVIKLAGNLSQLIHKNTYILFAISDYLIDHRTEISKAYKEKENTKYDWYDFRAFFKTQVYNEKLHEYAECGSLRSRY